MPFPPNSTERFQKREAERNAELNRFRDRMADISRINRENRERYAPSKGYGASEPAVHDYPDGSVRPRRKKNGLFNMIVAGFLIWAAFHYLHLGVIDANHPD